MQRTRRAVPRLACFAAENKNPFNQPREMDSAQKTLSQLPGLALYGLAALMMAAGGATGFFFGSRLPANMRTAGQVVGTVALAGGAAVTAKQLQEKRTSAAAIELYNELAALEDADSLSRQQVEAVGSKYGVDLAQKVTEELKQIYDTYLENLIPPGDVPLTGYEAEKIRNFKDALGLTDEDAAAVHLDVGRRFMRSRFEAGSQSEVAEQRKVLQKLIYVSTLVFGEAKSAFLLPWKRLFNLTDAQLYVARRDNAKALFKAHIESLGGELEADKEQLVKIKQYQSAVQLADDMAEEAIKEAARNRVEGCLERGIACIKRRTRVRDFSDAVKEVRNVLDFNRKLTALAADPDVPKGLGKATIYGGKLEADTYRRDLRELYKVYVEESVRLDGSFTDRLARDLAELQQVLALGQKEANEIVGEITSKAYRQLLREEVTSGRLDAAPSKAAVLEQLCEKLRFSPEAAGALHKNLYKQKLDTLLEKRKLTDSDAAELDRLRRLMCIPKKDITQLHKETCGRIFQAAVEDAMGAGVDRFGFADRKAVKAALADMRLSEELGKEILASVARKAFLGFITRSRSTTNKLEAAKELRRLVFFSNLVVTPLLADIKSAASATEDAKKEAVAKEMAEIMAKVKDDMAKEDADKAAVNAKELQAQAEGSEQEAESFGESAEAKPEGEAEGEAEASGAQSEADLGEAHQIAGSNENLEKPMSLKKAEDARKDVERAEAAGATPKSQKEVTLRTDLDLTDRLNIYRNFLMYCMQGDVVYGPMGTIMRLDRDTSEFARLSELGDILGLTPIDVSSVHTGLAEQAFRSQVQEALGDGILTKEKSEKLTALRDQMGLSKEGAEKIIKGVQNEKLIGTLAAQKATGALNLQKVLDMKEAGVDIDSFVSVEMRLTMYSKEIADVLSNGTGEFDSERLLERLPADLKLPERRARGVVEGAARDRKRTTLVQAISHLRQRNLGDAVKSINNLLACNKALPSDAPTTWENREELQDLYSVYLAQEKDQRKQDEVRQLFGISDKEAEALSNIVESGEFAIEEEEGSFF
ncbi:hypothetical protein WJX72_004725 [[Myrmecia] bisecta]|uniref:Uncharacterized protein n=1 Tax=[Myrmecia] bisecta TaxID=41462 RepID=A0AAW1R6F3_9CHLO